MRVRTRARGVGRLIALPVGGVRGSSLVFMLASLILFFTTALNPSSFQTFRIMVVDTAAPAMHAVYSPLQKASDYINAITGLAQLQSENLRLKQENLRLREWRETALALQSENKVFRDLMNVKAPQAKSFITVPVLVDSANSYAKSLLVLGGYDDGVKSGQAVMATEGLIGRVIEAGHTASRVLLLSDINSRVPVLVDQGNWRAVLAGQNEGKPQLVHLPPEAQISVGARVVTSGHGGLFPVGLPVGEVLQSEDGSYFVELYANVSRVSYVRIVDKIIDPNLRKGKL